MIRRENPLLLSRCTRGYLPTITDGLAKELTWRTLPFTEQQAWHSRLSDLRYTKREQNLLVALLQIPQISYELLSSNWERWYSVPMTRLNQGKKEYTKQQILLYTLGQIERTFLDFPLGYTKADSHVFCTNMLSGEHLRVYRDQKTSKDITPLLEKWQSEWLGRDQIILQKIISDEKYQEVKTANIQDFINLF